MTLSPAPRAPHRRRPRRRLRRGAGRRWTPSPRPSWASPATTTSSPTSPPSGFDAARGAASAAPSPRPGAASRSTTWTRVTRRLSWSGSGSPSSSTSRAEIARSQTSIASPLHELRCCFDLMATATEEGWRAVDARLAAVAGTLEGYRRIARGGRGRGDVSAQRQVAVSPRWPARSAAGRLLRRAGRRARSTAPRGHGPRRTAPGRPAAARRGGDRSVAAFGRFLGEELAPAWPRAATPSAGALRSCASRYFLGAAVDLEETYAWGLRSSRRIERRDGADRRRGPSPARTLEEAVARPRRRPRAVASRAPTRSATGCRSCADRGCRRARATPLRHPRADPDARVPHRPDARRAASTTPARARTSPGRAGCGGRCPQDVTRSAPGARPRPSTTRACPAITCRSARPPTGSDLLNRWRRLGCWVCGHGEGWALYAERLMEELGYLDDPADRLGHARRARRCAPPGSSSTSASTSGCAAPAEVGGGDVGRRQGLDVPARPHPAWPRRSLRFELDRYLGWPGQAPSYKVGERLWLRPRDEARARRGRRVRPAGVPPRALDLGSVGLDVLREALLGLDVPPLHPGRGAGTSRDVDDGNATGHRSVGCGCHGRPLGLTARLYVDLRLQAGDACLR